MPYRSPARFLAPIALLLVAVAIFSTVRANGGDDTSAAPSTTQGTTERTSTSERRTSTTASKRRSDGPRKTYTVKAGDVLSAIAEDTGVPLETLQELNPDVDAQSLRTGQKLKLAE